MLLALFASAGCWLWLASQWRKCAAAHSVLWRWLGTVAILAQGTRSGPCDTAGLFAHGEAALGEDLRHSWRTWRTVASLRSCALGRRPERSCALGRLPERGCASGRLPERGCASGRRPEQGCASGRLPERSCALGRLPERFRPSAQMPPLEDGADLPTGTALSTRGTNQLRRQYSTFEPPRRREQYGGPKASKHFDGRRRL